MWKETPGLPLWLVEIDFPVSVLGAAFVLFRIFALIGIPRFARSRAIVGTETVIGCLWVKTHDLPLLLDSECES